MEYRDEFLKALELLGRAFDEVVAEGYDRPVLVGGGAVEYYTAGAVTSGDFDVVTPNDTALRKALLHQGFRPETRPGHLLGGYYHPELSIVVEVVGRVLLEGEADPLRVAIVKVAEGSAVAVISTEDLIADRLGQFCSSPRGVGAMLDQAIKLYRLAPNLDEAYLDARIRTETAGECDLAFLKGRME
jgi:hypothetical protein